MPQRLCAPINSQQYPRPLVGVKIGMTEPSRPSVGGALPPHHVRPPWAPAAAKTKMTVASRSAIAGAGAPHHVRPPWAPVPDKTKVAVTSHPSVDGGTRHMRPPLAPAPATIGHHPTARRSLDFNSVAQPTRPLAQMGTIQDSSQPPQSPRDPSTHLAHALMTQCTISDAGLVPYPSILAIHNHISEHESNSGWIHPDPPNLAAGYYLSDRPAVLAETRSNTAPPIWGSVGALDSPQNHYFTNTTSPMMRRAATNNPGTPRSVSTVSRAPQPVTAISTPAFLENHIRQIQSGESCTEAAINIHRARGDVAYNTVVFFQSDREKTSFIKTVHHFLQPVHLRETDAHNRPIVRIDHDGLIINTFRNRATGTFTAHIDQRQILTCAFNEDHQLVDCTGAINMYHHLK